MKETIGIIGITGDLGSQLAGELGGLGYTVIGCSLSLPDSPSIAEIVSHAAIVHVCAPLSVLKELPTTEGTLIILHDSVMSSSLKAQKHDLQTKAAIVHMLMNDARSVILADESAQRRRTIAHFEALGYVTHSMSAVAHDQLMARSQAPLAILCQVLLPYLFEQQDKGLLTPSGELLAATLHSRQLAWTDETIRSILSNPQIRGLLADMTEIMQQAETARFDSTTAEKIHKKYSLGAALRRLQRSKRADNE